MEFLSNTWFVGIVGGLISAIVFFPIERFVSKRLYKAEYKKAIKEVNSKISKTLIMSISEGKIPSPNVISALLSSSAKKNGVKLKDINNVEETYDDLIYELFDAIFISVENKQMLANKLVEEKLASKEQLIPEKAFISSMNPNAFNETSILEKKLVQSMPLLLSLIIFFTILGVSSTIISFDGINLLKIMAKKDILEFIIALLMTFVGVSTGLNAIFSARSAKSKEEYEIKVKKKPKN